MGAIVFTVLVTSQCIAAQATDEEFEGWNLEPSLGKAHLVMVARVVSISQVTIVEGAKTDVALREYRFQPIRRLKGLFQRDQLSMTGSDLGLSSEDASLAPPLEEGEFRLLILAQQSGLTTYGCVAAAPGATTFAQRVPRVAGPDDPLVSAVDTLIKVADSRSRRERSTLLIDRLIDTDGVSAVPLLTGLRLRADWAAADRRALAPLTRLAKSSSTAARGAALEVLRDTLANRIMPREAKELDIVAESLREILSSDEAKTSVRLDALGALGHLLALKSDYAWASELLIAQLTRAATHAERTEAAVALSQIGHPQAVKAVLDALGGLPLDESAARESIYARAATRLDAGGAERVLLSRLQRSIQARQSLQAEVEALSRLRARESLPLLLAAASQVNLPSADRHSIAQALSQLRDERAVPVLIGWLRGDDHHLKGYALAALENLDSPLAAGEVRPLLKTEGHLPYKLRMARLLARHGFDDGYALATEHLSDQGHTAAAALVLAALNDPDTTKDLSAIVAARPDRRWHAAALVGLAAIGDAAVRKQLLDILSSDRHPLAADAAEAAGLAADGELLPPLAVLVRSRNTQIAQTSLAAWRRFLSGVRLSPRGLAAVEELVADDTAAEPESKLPTPAISEKTHTAISDAVSSLVLDAYVEPGVRQEALAVARLLGGQRYAQLLTELADQAELEGSPLLAAVQAELRRQRVVNK